MAIPDITQRHIAEWAFAWWRRETCPSLLRWGLFDDYEEIDEQMLGYADGASLSPSQAFAGLLDSLDPEADDFLADVAAGMLLVSHSGGTEEFEEWLSQIPDRSVAYEGYCSLMRWLGQPALPESDGWLESLVSGGAVARDKSANDALAASIVETALTSHRPSDLRFIDALGEVRGYFHPECTTLDAPSDTDDLGCICSYLLAHHDQVQATLQQVIGNNHDPAIAFLVAGVSGDLALLPWLIQCLDQPQLTYLAADAFRRITGFDAIGTMELEDCDADGFDKEEIKALVGLVKTWYADNAETWGAGYRFFGTTGGVQDIARVLREGCQLDRELAAMRATMHTQAFIFPVRSRIDIQLLVMNHHFPESREAT